jgi:PAS domain S-box-containing protein
MDSESPDFDAQLDLLVDVVVDYAICMLDSTGVVLSWDAGAGRLMGYQREEIIGQHFSRFYPPEDRLAELPQQALEAAREGRFAAEGWRVRNDGSRFWAEVVMDPISDPEGKLIGFANMTRNVTARREAKATLLASERRYRLLVEAVVDYAIFQLAVDGRIATWNRGAERAKGYTRDEAIGRHFSIFYTEEDRAAGMPDRALATAASEGRFEAEGWRVRKDGTRFWAMVVIDAIYDENGKLSGFAKVTRDITERQDAQQKLREAQQQLLASQKMEAVGQLSGGIAHDFNNLLMIVLGNLESAARQARQVPESTNLQRSLANAMRGAQRAAALTSRLLAFSRRQALDPKPIDAGKFIHGSVDFLQRSLGETIEIEAVGNAGIWTIEADPNQLESALVNLAINARDAMPTGGKLTIEAANVFADSDYVRMNPELSEGQYVAICITDTGAGMTSDVLARVFEPFFTTKEAGHGTGLGLSQVYGFVKQSGGNVKIYSEVGQGTTVKMYFPRFVQPQAESEEVELIPIAQAETSETVLLVEDDPDLRTYLGEMLRELKYRVIVTPNAQAALHVLVDDQKQIDLLLTDVIMPGMNGRELARRAEALRPGLAVLYMTGYSRNAVVHQGRLDEGVELVQKPVSQTQLANRIREILDRQLRRPNRK